MFIYSKIDCFIFLAWNGQHTGREFKSNPNYCLCSELKWCHHPTLGDFTPSILCLQAQDPLPGGWPRKETLDLWFHLWSWACLHYMSTTLSTLFSSLCVITTCIYAFFLWFPLIQLPPVGEISPFFFLCCLSTIAPKFLAPEFYIKVHTRNLKFYTINLAYI